MNRREYFEIALPAVRQLVHTSLNIHRDSTSIVFLGPSDDEIAAIVPDLTSVLDLGDKDRAFPLEGTINLERFVRDYTDWTINENRWEFCDGGGSWRSHEIVFVLLPPSCRVDVHPLENVPSRLGNCNAGILVQAVLPMGACHSDCICVWTVVLSNTLDSRDAIELLRLQHKQWLQSFGLLKPSAIKRFVKDSVVANPQPTQYGVEEARKDARDTALYFPESTDQYRRFPALCWYLHADNKSESLVILGSQNEYHKFIHARQFDGESQRRLRDDRGFAESLLAIALGSKNRSEDDCFTSIRETIESDNWRVKNRSVQMSSRVGERYGFSLCRIEDVVSFEPVESPQDTVQRVAVCLRGRDAGKVFRRLPEPIKEVQSSNQYILLYSPNADVLFRILSLPYVYEALVCSAYGSLESPVIAPSSVRDLLVPWPSVQSMALLKEVIGARKSTLELLADQIGDLEPWIGELDEEADSGCLDDICWLTQLVRDDLVSIIERITKDVEAQENSEGFPETWPAPIAILARRSRGEQVPQTRLTRILDLAEVLIRTDAVFVSSAVAAITPSQVGEILRRNQILNGDKAKFSLGHWVALARSGRQFLNDNAAIVDCSPIVEALQPILSVKSQEYKRLVEDVLVPARNSLKGHGFTPPDHIAETECDRLQKAVESAKQLLSYMARTTLFDLEAVEPDRKKTKIRRRMLVHENPEFELQIIERPNECAYRSLHVDETYLALSPGDSLLPLWPFIRYGAQAPGQPKRVWMLDKIDGKKLVYVCPIEKTEEWKVPEGDEFAARMLSRHHDE